MLGMIRTLATLICLLAGVRPWAPGETRATHPSYDYDAARAHEIKRIAARFHSRVCGLAPFSFA